jgi:hypothetical protein
VKFLHVCTGHRRLKLNALVVLKHSVALILSGGGGGDVGTSHK